MAEAVEKEELTEPQELVPSRFFQPGLEGKRTRPGERIWIDATPRTPGHNLELDPNQVKGKKFVKLEIGEGEKKKLWLYILRGRNPRGDSFLLERSLPNSPEAQQAEENPDEVFTLENP